MTKVDLQVDGCTLFLMEKCLCVHFNDVRMTDRLTVKSAPQSKSAVSAFQISCKPLSFTLEDS